MKTTYFKILSNGKSCNGGRYDWSLPKYDKSIRDYIPGEWTEQIYGRLIPCKQGFHLAEDEHLFTWYARETDVYVAEKKYRLYHAGDKVVVRQVRLVRPVKMNLAYQQLALVRTVVDLYDIVHPKVKEFVDSLLNINKEWSNHATFAYCGKTVKKFFGGALPAYTGKYSFYQLVEIFVPSEYGLSVDQLIAMRKIADSLVTFHQHDTRAALLQLPTRGVYEYKQILRHFYGWFRYYAGLDSEPDTQYSATGKYGTAES